MSYVYLLWKNDQVLGVFSLPRTAHARMSDVINQHRGEEWTAYSTQYPEERHVSCRSIARLEIERHRVV